MAEDIRKRAELLLQAKQRLEQPRVPENLPALRPGQHGCASGRP